MTVEDVEIESSVLGTKSYWDAIYDRDLSNFRDFGDAGEIWFGETCVETMVEWVDRNYIEKSVSIVDIGCGNGHLLFELEELGYINMDGFDYSESSIALCKEIANGKSSKAIFQVVDLTNDKTVPCEKYDLALDKGTFDALSLAPSERELDKSKRDTRLIGLYAKNVSQMLCPKGILLISSCNWTVEELSEYFSKHFELVERVGGKKPAFMFGGQLGSTECTAVFRRKFLSTSSALSRQMKLNSKPGYVGRTENREDSSNENNTFSNYQVHRLQRSGGLDVVVYGSNVFQAYSKLRNMTKDSNLRELQRRFTWYIKPKHMRQLTAEKMAKARRSQVMKEKIAIAMEIIKKNKEEANMN